MTYYLIKLWPYRMKYREWRLGRFVLRIVQIGKRDWYAAVWPTEAPEFIAYADKCAVYKCAVFRSRSRALDVGQRMLKLSAGRGRAVGLG